MKKIIGIFFILALSQIAFSQDWVDTIYEISSVYDVEYGVSTDFKGADYVVEMDISIPNNDTPPECGRPLMIIVHGGAFYAGDKSDGYPLLLREDFAQRGYVTASVNYRLGMFNTHLAVNCNLEGWNCWNMTDTSEWYRAYYRAIQDIRAAIRYMVNEKEAYNINPDNIFLVGESAGGFIVLGAGFIDDQSEILEELISEKEDVLPPNSIYESDCIQAFGLANSISDMNLNRPDLGAIEGELNLPVQDSFRIRGVGSFYGGAFNNIFEAHSVNSPALYLFHQPCDLIVPFHYNKLLAGYSTCATQFPSFCQHVINRSFIYGSNAITALIDDLATDDIPTSEYLFDNSGNTYSCLEQVVNASLGCHAIDNYWQRTSNMASFFADQIVDCTVNSSSEFTTDTELVEIYPNPVKDVLNLRIARLDTEVRVRITDALGRVFYNGLIINKSKK
jgi:hypothetical protein